MGALATITNVTPTGVQNSIGANGAVTVHQGTFTSGATTCTCPVGDLTAQDLVLVQPVQATGSFTKPYVEILASRTTGSQGVVTVGFQDGSAGPAATQIIRIIKIKI
jgi:hypothetical protein